MGRDKAFVSFEGTPMVARVATALRGAGCHPVIAIGGDEDALGRLGLTVIADRWPGEGPLGGVITALDHFSTHDLVVPEVVLIAACDLPRLSTTTATALIRALVDAPAGTDVAMATTDRPQPLCAAWRPTAAAPLSATFAAGGRRLLDALSDLRVVDVVVDADQLTNVNSVADLPG